MDSLKNLSICPSVPPSICLSSPYQVIPKCIRGTRGQSMSKTVYGFVVDSLAYFLSCGADEIDGFHVLAGQTDAEQIRIFLKFLNKDRELWSTGVFSYFIYFVCGWWWYRSWYVCLGQKITLGVSSLFLTYGSWGWNSALNGPRSAIWRMVSYTLGDV